LLCLVPQLVIIIVVVVVDGDDDDDDDDDVVLRLLFLSAFVSGLLSFYGPCSPTLYERIDLVTLLSFGFM